MYMLSAVVIVLGIYVLARIVGVVAENRFLDYVDWWQERTTISNSATGELFQAAGTSSPEIAINAYAVYIASANPVVGLMTIIGSALFQLTVVLAVPFFVAPRSTMTASKVFRSASVYGGAVLLLLLAAYDTVFVWWELLVFVVAYAIYAWYVLRDFEDVAVETVPSTDKERWWSWIDRPARRVGEWVNALIPGPEQTRFGFLGVLLVIGGVSAATVELAVLGGDLIGVPSAVMAITVLAAASSIPEISSNMAKARAGNVDQVVGNAIGSNTFDILISFGGVSLVAAWLRRGVSMPAGSAVFEAAGLLLSALVIVITTFWLSDWEVKTWTPYCLLGVYAASIVGYVVIATA